MTRKSRKNNQVKETVRDLKMEIEAIKKTKTDVILEMDKRTRATDALSTEFKRGKRKSQASKTQ